MYYPVERVGRVFKLSRRRGKPNLYNLEGGGQKLEVGSGICKSREVEAKSWKLEDNFEKKNEVESKICLKLEVGSW